MPASGKLRPMKKVPPSDDAVRLARIAFGNLNASVGWLMREACYTLALRKASDFPHSATHLLLQAAHQKNTRT